MARVACWALVTALCASCVDRMPARAPGAADRGNAAVIFVVRRGWHVDLGISTADLAPSLRQVTTFFPGARYLLFGFGDRRYVETLPHAAASGMIAALWPGPGVLLLTGLRTPPADAFGGQHAVEMTLDAAGLASLQEFLQAAFVRDAQGSIGTPAMGPYGGSAYFSAAAAYSAFHTCNTWAAEALEAAGLPLRSRGILFAGQLWRRVNRIASSDRSAAGRLGPVLTDGGGRTLRDDDGGAPLRRGGRAAADAPGQDHRCEQGAASCFHNHSDVVEPIVEATILHATTGAAGDARCTGRCRPTSYTASRVMAESPSSTP